ncbi:MAG: acetyl/propionyl/methylcrotonyl-CoA carboxylase subunit alpha [bacterium]
MQKIVVANRGAIARRIIRTCETLGIASIAVYSEADADAPYLSEASEAYALKGFTAADTYLNQDVLLDIAQESGADAVHPGYGFLAENAGFAQRVIDGGFTFVGPAPRWLAAMGDKVAARALLAEQGFPMFAGSGKIEDVKSASIAADEIGYPVMVKPSGGGGGMGMQVVSDPARLEEAVLRAKAIGVSAFDQAGVYLEKYIEQPRHIEFQILADGQGNAMHLYERECSVQRRNQKLIEETPAPGLSPELLERHAAKSAQVCAELNYDNIGTLETLFTSSGDMGFLEMNTRIQVEHGVTEAVTGCDLVALQISLAQGECLPVQPARRGYAIEARLYAEDGDTLLPSTGRLSVFTVPRMYGIRIETGYAQGQQVTPYYDAMLAKVIAHGETRELAIGRLSVALQAFEVVGVKTNARLLRRILQSSDFLEGRVDTGIVDRLMGEK